MQPWRAIKTGLRRSFDFGGVSSRAEYLPFLFAAILAFAAALALGSAVLPKGTFAPFALGLLTLFYIPVTSAGMRRLRDAGQPALLMLNPLKPAIAALIVFWALLLILQTPLGFAVFYLTALVASPLFVALIVLGILVVSVVTAIHVTDTASRLLLPTSLRPPFQPEASK